MRKRWALLVALMFFGGSIGYASIIGFGGACVTTGTTACSSLVNTPGTGTPASGASATWASDVLSNLPGTSINTGTDFNGMPIGSPSSVGSPTWTLVTSGTYAGGYSTTFYSYLGISSITVTGMFANWGVNDGNSTGPGDPGNSMPTSPGEGVHPSNDNFLGPKDPDISQPAGAAYGQVVFTFSSPVAAFGLYVIDLYNPGNSNPDTLVAYDNSGTQIAAVTAVGDNFQVPSNSQYFMGLLSSSNNVKSVVFTNSPTGYPDFVALDSIRFDAAVPEPGSLGLIAAGLAWLGLRFRKRRLT